MVEGAAQCCGEYSPKSHPAAGLADTVRGAVNCSGLFSAPQRQAKKGLPTEEVWAEACPVFMRPFSLHSAAVTTPGHPTHMCS